MVPFKQSGFRTQVIQFKVSLVLITEQGLRLQHIRGSSRPVYPQLRQ